MILPSISGWQMARHPDPGFCTVGGRSASEARSSPGSSSWNLTPVFSMYVYLINRSEEWSCKYPTESVLNSHVLLKTDDQQAASDMEELGILQRCSVCSAPDSVQPYSIVKSGVQAASKAIPKMLGQKPRTALRTSLQRHAGPADQ